MNPGSWFQGRALTTSAIEVQDLFCRQSLDNDIDSCLPHPNFKYFMKLQTLHATVRFMKLYGK
jgi:hypothetical protein